MEVRLDPSSSTSTSATTSVPSSSSSREINLSELQDGLQKIVRLFFGFGIRDLGLSNEGEEGKERGGDGFEYLKSHPISLNLKKRYLRLKDRYEEVLENGWKEGVVIGGVEESFNLEIHERVLGEFYF